MPYDLNYNYETNMDRAIGFGLVNIPVKLLSAVQESELNLDMLDKKDHSHIRYLRVNENKGKEVEWENIAKGYLLNDKYVVLDDKDFQSANAVKTKVIEISDFVDKKKLTAFILKCLIT